MPLTYKDLSIMDARSRFERQFYSPAVPRPTEFSNPTIPRTPNPTVPQPNNNVTNNGIVQGSQQPQQLQQRGIGVIPNVPLQTSDGRSFQFKDQNEVKDYQSGRPIDEILRDRQALQRLNDPYSNSGVFGFIPGLRDKFSYSENGIGGFRDQYLADRKRKDEYDKRHKGNQGATGNGFNPANPLSPPMPGNPPQMKPPGNFNPPGNPGSPGSPSADSPNPSLPNPGRPNQPKPPANLPNNPNNPGNPGSFIPNQFIPQPPGLPASELPPDGHNYDFPPDSPIMTFTVQSTFVMQDYGIRLDGSYFPAGTSQPFLRGMSQPVTGIPVRITHRKTLIASGSDGQFYFYDVVVYYKANQASPTLSVTYSGVQDSNRSRFMAVTSRVEPTQGSPIQFNPLAPATPPRPPLPPDFELPKLDDLMDQLDQFQQRLDQVNNLINDVQQIGDTLNDIRDVFPTFNPNPNPQTSNPVQPKANPSPSPNPSPNLDPKNQNQPKPNPKNMQAPKVRFDIKGSPGMQIPLLNKDYQDIKAQNPNFELPVNNQGQVSDQAQQQFEQQKAPIEVPNQKTDSLCNDPCIADLQRKQRDNDKDTTEIEVPIFKACKVDPGEGESLAESNQVKLTVPKNQSAMIAQMFLRLFEIESMKCRQDSESSVPETMAIRAPDNRPILKITYRQLKGGKVGESKWTSTIPWFTGGKPAVPKTYYTRGDTRVAYSFPDGSHIIVNARNETEGMRVIRQWLKGTDQNKSRNGTFKVTKSQKDGVNQSKIKPVKIAPISASFYPQGDGFINGVRATPAWTVKLR